MYRLFQQKLLKNNTDEIQKVYYNCSPFTDLDKLAFMTVSVNTRSPYLTDNEKVKNVVKYLSNRSKIKGELHATVIYVCDEIFSF